MAHIFAAEPNTVHVTPDEILKEIEKVMRKYPGVAFITMIGPLGDPSQLACLTNLSKDATRERLRNGIKQMNEGRIVVPGRA